MGILKKRKPGRPKSHQDIVIGPDYAGMYDSDGRHCIKRFKVKKQKVGEKILIELTPFKKLDNRRAELIESVAEKLKDNLDSKELMKDILGDTSLNRLEKLDKAIKRGAKVRSREGCYYLEVKDKRLKKPMNVFIRK